MRILQFTEFLSGFDSPTTQKFTIWDAQFQSESKGFFLTEKLRFMQQQGLFVNWKTKIIYSPKNPNSQVHQRQIRNWAAFKFRPWSPTVMCMGPTILIGNLDPNLNLVFRKKCFGEIWIPKPHTLQPISSRCVNARGDTWREGPMSFVFRCSCGCIDSSRKMVKG